MTEKQRKYIEHLIRVTDADAETLLAYFGYDALGVHTTRSEASRVIKALESKRRAA
jgi:YD repeat-containing protein